MRIGLDVDGVLADWESHARRLIFSRFGLQLPISTEWDSIKKSVTPKQWTWLWNEGLAALFTDIQPYPGIRRAVEMLGEVGEVIVITKAPRVAIPERLIWLINHGIFFDEFHVIKSTIKKSTVLCDVYIDDSTDVTEDILSKTNSTMILWNRPWNSGDNTPKSSRVYYRVDSWDQAIDICTCVKEQVSNTTSVSR